MNAYVRPLPPNSARTNNAPKPRKRRVPWLLVGGTLAAALVFVLSITAVMALAYFTQGSQIASGVTVAGVPVGGQSAERAASILEQYTIPSRPVTLSDGDRTWSLTLADLGVRVDIPATVQLAEQAASGTDVQPWYTIDLSQTQTALIALSEAVNIDAVPGNPPQIGRSIDIPVILNRLYQNLAGEIGDGRLELSMIEVQPPEEESVNRSSTATTVHVVEQGQELALIAREYGVSVQDIVSMNDISNPDLLYVGQELVIPAAGIYTPSAADAPAAPTSTGKSIVVSTGEQRIYAYENGQLIRSDLVSTGLPGTPTVLGDYRIYVKYTATDMSGPDYYLPQVPYTMYFFEGYGIHGTYWHNSFGRPMSHGCVNLPTPEAQWFFDWAEVGTPVRVI